MNIRTSWLGGLGLGAGLMYLLDPDRGRRRRDLVRDRVSSRVGRSESSLGKTARDSANRARGLLWRARGRIVPEGRVADDVLAERVRSKMGRHVSHPGAIEVAASRGRITLSGPVLAYEVDDLVDAVASVRGVREIENWLQVHQEPGDVPGLQGPPRRTGETSEFLQDNWTPAARLAAGTAGGTLLLLGLARLGKLGAAATAIGAGLLTRSVANQPLRRLAAVGVGPEAVDEDLERQPHEDAMKTPAKRYHVLPEGQEWVVRLEESMVDEVRARTRDEAIERGEDKARAEQAELVIHEEDGGIGEERAFV